MKRRAFLSLLPASLLSHPVFAQTDGPGVALIFIGASWCPYCAQIAPLLAPLPQHAGVPVLVASLDNAPIAPFAEFVDGREHPLARQTNRIPHILVFNQRLGDVTHQIDQYRNPRHFVELLRYALVNSQTMGQPYGAGH